MRIPLVLSVLGFPGEHSIISISSRVAMGSFHCFCWPHREGFGDLIDKFHTTQMGIHSWEPDAA